MGERRLAALVKKQREAVSRGQAPKWRDTALATSDKDPPTALHEACFVLQISNMSPTKSVLFLIAALVLLTSCGGSPTEPRDYEFGRADVYVRDAEGQPINGVQVRMDRSSGQTEDAGGLTGTVGLPGYYFFLKTGGDYRIVITPPSGYELAPGQTATAPFTFRREQVTTINFTLRRV